MPWEADHECTRRIKLLEGDTRRHTLALHHGRRERENENGSSQWIDIPISKTRIWSGDAVSFPLLTMREPHPIYQPLILNLGHDRRADVAGFLVSSGEKTTSSPGHTDRILRTKKKRSEGKLSDFVCLLLIVTKTEARGTGQIVLNPLALAVDTNSSPFTWSRNCV